MSETETETLRLETETETYITGFQATKCTNTNVLNVHRGSPKRVLVCYILYLKTRYV